MEEVDDRDKTASLVVDAFPRRSTSSLATIRRPLMSIQGIAFSFIALGLLASSVSDATAAAYRISAHLSHKGHQFAAPVIVVREGVPAAVEVAGDDGYRLTVTVTPATSGTVKVATDLHTAYGAISPAMVVQLGQPASLTIGEIQMSLTAEVNGS
jgi:hypothetical protein